MRTWYSLRFRQFILIGILVSLVYNAMWLGGYVLLISWREERLFLSTVIFLFTYLFLIQPWKDFLISRWTKTFAYHGKNKIYQMSERVSHIEDLDDAYDFLREFTENLYREPLHVIFFVPQSKSLTFQANGKKEEGKFGSEKFEFVRGVIESEHRSEVLREFSKTSDTAAMMGIQSFVPVRFREKTMGVVFTSIALPLDLYELLEHFSRQLAVILEKKELQKKIPRSELLNREFRTARAVGALLGGKKEYDCCGVLIQRITSSWEDAYFNTLLEVTYPENQRGQRNFVILARLTSSSVRVNSVQLFQAQGYFASIVFSLSPEENILHLTSRFNDALVNRENAKINLDGCIVEVQENNMSLVHFGTGVSARFNHQSLELSRRPSIGSDLWEDVSFTDLNPFDTLVVGIKNFPLLQFSREVQK